jgi:hypothetical protein
MRPCQASLRDVLNFLESKRMASGFIGNEVPRKGLRVRISCSPLFFLAKWPSVHGSVHELPAQLGG